VPFSGSLWERKSRVSARPESSRGETLDRRDSLAEGSEFEPAVPVYKLSDDSIMFEFATPRRIALLAYESPQNRPRGLAASCPYRKLRKRCRVERFGGPGSSVAGMHTFFPFTKITFPLQASGKRSTKQ